MKGTFYLHKKSKTPFGEVEAPGRVQLKEGKNGVWEYTSSILPSEMYNYSVYVNDFKTTDPSNVYQNRDIATITNYFLIGNGQADLYMVQDVPHGTVSKVWYNCPTLGMERRLTVYTPAVMKAATRNIQSYTCCMEPEEMKMPG
mgnify:CR=1 FL=1